MSREEQIINERKKKIEELRKHGINSYAYRFDKKQSCAECLKSKPGTKIKTAGRLMTKREFGKIAFAKLQDFSGQIQIVFQNEKTPEKIMNFFKKYLDAGDFVGLEGKIFKTKTGEISVLASKIELLTKSILPLPEKFHGLQDKEERYRKRYLDLIMNPEVKEVFKTKAKIIDAIRDFLDKKGYIEVDSPMLQPIYGGGSARPFETHLHALKMKIYLSISTELYLKRLITGGFEKVYAMNRLFRNEGIDSTHNPEFTMLETMWAYNDYTANMDLFEEMIETISKKVLGRTKINYQGKEIELKRPWKRMKMTEAIKHIGKLDVEKMSDTELKKKLKELKIEVPVFKRGIAVEEIFSELVEPKLIQPTIIYDYPYETCGLAKQKKDNPKYAERFEPFINGWEMGNNYSELNNPEVLEKYWKEQEKDSKLDSEAQKLDEDFLTALKIGMPPTTGLGLGVDRLVMLLTNQPSIRDVILFPFMKTEEGKKI
jgi:lysyl-tRNA synthetase class 2